MYSSLRPRRPQHTRYPCPALSSGACSNSHPRVGDAIQPSHPCYHLLLPPSIFPSIRIFLNESALCIRWPKYWSFGFSIGPSNESSGLISFRIDWFDLLAVQTSLKSLPAPQFESINPSVLRLLYGPDLTSIHDYWKNHSIDYMDLCR